jgi:hypothetical protein
METGNIIQNKLFSCKCNKQLILQLLPYAGKEENSITAGFGNKRISVK